MSFTVPDYGEGSVNRQSVLMEADIQALVANISGDGLITGCEVTEDANGASMDLDITSGEVVINGLSVAVSGGVSAVTVTAADASNPRIDIVTVDSAGTCAMVDGTAATNPTAPDLPSDEVMLAMVYVPAGDTAIADAQITDKRTDSPLRQVVLAQETLSAAGRFDFSSLSQQYDHLILRGVTQISAGGNTTFLLYFNNDTTAANYARGQIIKAGGAPSVTLYESDNPYFARTCLAGAVENASDFGVFEAFLPLYAGSLRKHLNVQWGVLQSAGSEVGIGTYHWRSTSAINQITLQPYGYSSDNFVTDSYFQVIGVR